MASFDFLEQENPLSSPQPTLPWDDGGPAPEYQARPSGAALVTTPPSPVAFDGPHPQPVSPDYLVDWAYPGRPFGSEALRPAYSGNWWQDPALPGRVQTELTSALATPGGRYADPDPNYWIRRIGEDAGAHDWNYWKMRMNTPGVPEAAGQFNDPGTAALQGGYTQLAQMFEQQRIAQEQANELFRAKMPDVQASTDRLIAYLNQRSSQLQGPAYTGPEQEILRTQALDPIERDRAAANQRALESIGARGLTPESGISQELTNRVNAVFDQQRAGAQGDLAYRTILEQRSRDQEAQQLLGMVPQVQRAGATGDLSFLRALDAAVAQPAGQQIQALQGNYQLPRQAMSDALAALGLDPSPGAIAQSAGTLFDANAQRSNANDYAMGQLMYWLASQQ